MSTHDHRDPEDDGEDDRFNRGYGSEHIHGGGYDERGYGGGQSGYAAGYRGEPRDLSAEPMGYGGYGPDERWSKRGRSGYGRGWYAGERGGKG